MYQYIIKLQDMLSTPAMQMAAKWNNLLGAMDRVQQRVTGGFQRNWQRVGDVMRRAGGSIDDIRKKLDGLRKYRDGLDINLDTSGIKAVNREIDTLERKLARLEGRRGGGVGRTVAGGLSALGGGMSGLLLAGGVYGAAAYGVLQAGQAAAQATISPAMQRETTRFQLNELTNSPAFVKQLEKQFAGYAPEKMGELFSSAQKLLGAGVGQGELMGNIKMLNNLSALSNTKVDELAFILSKVRATGYVQGDEMDMFRERGINLNPYLAKVMGVQENQIKKLQEKGLITYDKFAKALEMFVGPGSRFANVAERKRDSTSQGRYDFLMGQFNERLVAIGVKVLPLVNKGLEYTMNLFDRITLFGEPINKLVAAFEPLLYGTGRLLQAFGVLDEKMLVSAGFVERLAQIIELISIPIKGLALLFEKVIVPVISKIQQASALFSMQGLMDAGKTAKDFGGAMAVLRTGRNGSSVMSSSQLQSYYEAREGGDDAAPSKPTKAFGTSSGIGQAAGIDAAVSGAAKKHITLNVQSLIQKSEIHVAQINEGVADLESKVVDALLRAINSATAMA